MDDLSTVFDEPIDNILNSSNALPIESNVLDDVPESSNLLTTNGK